MIGSIKVCKGRVNIYVIEKELNNCECSLNATVGEQKIDFSSKDGNLKDRILEFLISKMNFTGEEKKDVSIIGKIKKNLKIHIGANEEISDIMKAVQRVSDRDMSQLNLENFDPIYIPKLFIAKNAEGIDLDLYAQELKKKKEYLQGTIDFAKADELNTLEFHQKRAKVQ